MTQWVRTLCCYLTVLAGLAYAGTPLIEDLMAGPTCCTHDDDCETLGSGFVCCDTDACDGEETLNYECVAGCQDTIGNYYCPGAALCEPI
jgi:hypothetical protein